MVGRIVTILMVMGTVVTLAPVSEAAPAVVVFSATGAQQEFIVPSGVHTVTVVAVGGKGGDGGGSGGFGATVQGTIGVTPGEKLFIEVGDNGRSGVNDSQTVFNGGGLGADGSGSGGGASDVRRCTKTSIGCGPGTSFDSRLVVAGGGGGGGATALTYAGGAGGAGGLSPASGTDGTASPGGSGGLAGTAATSSGPGSGGSAGSGNNFAGLSGTDGSLDQGGDGRSPGTTSSPGGGGGGGYFGGGGGGGGGRDSFGQVAGGGGGGAGSNFVDPSATGALTATDNTGTPSVTISYDGPPSTVLASPSSLSFGRRRVRRTGHPKTLTITDNGASALQISSITFTGANPGDFYDGGDDCRAVIAPGGSCSASIFFVPHARGRRRAQLVITSNDPSSPTLVPLSGRGV